MPPTPQITIRLDPKWHKRVRKWGNGNITAGIRYAIEVCAENENERKDPLQRAQALMALPTDVIGQRVYIMLMKTSILRTPPGEVYKSLTTYYCQIIVGKLEKRKAQQKDVLTKLLTDGFIRRADDGYRPCIRSNQKVSAEVFTGAIRDLRDYLHGIGKYEYVLSSTL